MTGWLRRNRWALIVLVLLVPASLAAALSINTVRYYEGQVHDAVTIAKGESGEYVPDRPLPEDEDAPAPDPAPPATLTLDDFTVVPWDSDTGREVGLMEGTEAVSAIIDVDATGMPEDVYSCDALLIAPGPSGERVWEMAGGSDIDYFPSGDLTGYCSLNDGEHFLWEAVFVVPEGVAENADLYITRGSVVPERVLLLEH